MRSMRRLLLVNLKKDCKNHEDRIICCDDRIISINDRIKANADRITLNNDRISHSAR
ncbi:hypothetical protein [Sporolactobacillus laevolacticus]|uniref:hypothetical protein n=1 Tax=Sporolactobacillus laevolacticus TaxID=33018 RepID=UPI0025B2B6E3|nr:hypothetical protein [Sporolactobacillus laevolacticus]MDN3956069.1 hypothetical protein [Sporolactobacillus laevolacticus]